MDVVTLPLCPPWDEVQMDGAWGLKAEGFALVDKARAVILTRLGEVRDTGGKAKTRLAGADGWTGIDRVNGRLIVQGYGKKKGVYFCLQVEGLGILGGCTVEGGEGPPISLGWVGRDGMTLMVSARAGGGLDLLGMTAEKTQIYSLGRVRIRDRGSIHCVLGVKGKVCIGTDKGVVRVGIDRRETGEERVMEEIRAEEAKSRKRAVNLQID